VAQAASLEAMGRDPGVRVGDGATLAFLDGAAGRDRLLPDGDGVRSRRGGERLDSSALARIGRDEPERLSPNVLLRPVVESAILPTTAYLAGPGELRYLALAEPLYQALGIHRQQPTPRWSGLLVEPRVARTLDKFGATIADLDNPGQLEQRVLRTLAPADFEPAFADLRAALEAGYDRIAAVAREIDPTLEKPALSAKGGALGAAADLEKKLFGAQKRRQGELVGQLERARAAIWPLATPQERVIGVPAIAGRYGLEFVTEVAERIDRWYAEALEGAPAPA